MPVYIDRVEDGPGGGRTGWRKDRVEDGPGGERTRWKTDQVEDGPAVLYQSTEQVWTRASQYLQNKAAMTLVLSMNPFCDHESEPPPTIYQPIWESEHSGPAHSSSVCNAQELNDGPAYRGAAHHVTMSRITYFKRKYVEDDNLPLNFRSYRHTVSPLLEEHNHVLHLSLDKMRFIDDPEVFLRRSVLINNLLRRLRAEILLQGAWPFVAGSVPVSLTTPVSAHHDLSRKRLRFLQEEEDECVSACCCFYEASRYMQLPVCVYERDVQPSSSSSPSSAITERLEHLFEEEAEEEEEEEELESEGEEELDSLCPGLDLCEASLKAREKLGERETPKERR
ncbi:SERTA domain-containing protein 4 isoform X3 [Tachysurus fulvidraco]|uniref:SERTA domain-containing protein 4 isoform X3 n=1 Tax=Tachysurus fulvidraco TaxID=1234273 RepID=UPI001FF00C7E|nr:SERTA domain-containing protein 4 isoform X3 [Tachysurus fulvidraco]